MKADMGGVPVRDRLQLCLALALVILTLLVPLDYASFRLLGSL